MIVAMMTGNNNEKCVELIMRSRLFTDKIRSRRRRNSGIIMINTI